MAFVDGVPEAQAVPAQEDGEKKGPAERGLLLLPECAINR